MEFADQTEGLASARGDQDLKPFVARQVAQYSSVVGIVFDDEQDGIVGLQILAIIGNLLRRSFDYTHRR